MGGGKKGSTRPSTNAGSAGVVSWDGGCWSDGRNGGTGERGNEREGVWGRGAGRWSSPAFNECWTSVRCRVGGGKRKRGVWSGSGSGSERRVKIGSESNPAFNKCWASGEVESWDVWGQWGG